MKKHLLLVASVICLLPSLTIAQEIEWQNTIGGSDDENFATIQPTPDGGYICGGHSLSDISGDKTENNAGAGQTWDYWILKLDSAGNIQWQNSIGGNSNDKVKAVLATNDGGYIVGGYSTSNIGLDKTENSHGNEDYWVLKLDSIGNIIWQNTVGGSGSDFLDAIDVTADGGVICGGHSNSGISGDKTEPNSQGDYWIVKLDSAGALEWEETLGGSEADACYSIKQTADGNYICGGYSLSNISGDKSENSQGGPDFWIVKIDNSGNIIWQNTIGGGNSDYLTSISQTSDGGYICGGHSLSQSTGDKTENSNGLADCWILKLDSLGNIQWQNTIGGSGEDGISMINQMNDGNYICSSNSNSNISGDKAENSNGGYDYWAFKLDTGGNIIWQNTIGGTNSDVTRSIYPTNDGGYICGGESASPISGDKTENAIGDNDYWVMKICNNPTISYNISGCAPYTYSNQVWLTSGIYHDTLDNPAGCDLYIDFNFTSLNPVIAIIPDGPTTFCQGDSVLLSAPPNLTNYQWYRYNTAISGAVTEDYIAKSKGKYKCVAQDTSCSGISNIITVNIPCIPLGPTHEKSMEDRFDSPLEFSVFPNPGTGFFSINSPNGKISIYNTLGILVNTTYVDEKSQLLDLSEFENGYYFVFFNSTDLSYSKIISLIK